MTRKFKLSFSCFIQFIQWIGGALLLLVLYRWDHLGVYIFALDAVPHKELHKKLIDLATVPYTHATAAGLLFMAKTNKAEIGRAHV